MKKLFVLLVLLLCLPFERSDVADLLPIRALTVDVSAEGITLDGGEAAGVGATLEEALENLHETAVGTVFLETAKYVVLSPRAAGLSEELSRWEALRPATRVVLASGSLPDADAAADYLASHDPGLTLGQLRGAFLRGETVSLPLLEYEEGTLHLVHGSYH